MAPDKVLRVGIIVGSQRVVRVAPQIADFILGTIKNTQNNSADPAVTFDVVDLKTQNLPLFDESTLAIKVKSADEYDHEHTRAWSRRIAALDAFVFVTSQRNWGYPSELKNAIDYLYHEWKGKPAIVVTYGGHGGGHAGDQLRTVLGALGMRVVDQKIGMTFPDRDFSAKCTKGQDLGLDADNDKGVWAEHRPEITSAWEDLMQKLLKEVKT